MMNAKAVTIPPTKLVLLLLLLLRIPKETDIDDPLHPIPSPTCIILTEDIQVPRTEVEIYIAQAQYDQVPSSLNHPMKGLPERFR